MLSLFFSFTRRPGFDYTRRVLQRILRDEKDKAKLAAFKASKEFKLFMGFLIDAPVVLGYEVHTKCINCFFGEKILDRDVKHRKPTVSAVVHYDQRTDELEALCCIVKHLKGDCDYKGHGSKAEPRRYDDNDWLQVYFGTNQRIKPTDWERN